MIRSALPLLAALFASSYVSAADFSGRAAIVDGDTLAIEGVEERIRLYGVDTPEGQQTCDDASGKRYLCGSRAAEVLAAIIGRSGRVSCREEDRDRYSRIVAACTAGGVDVNGELVRQGWALEYREYSDGRYADEEAEAREAERGLWAGEFIEPWDWRRGERLASERVASGQPEGCEIKGNISDNGRIYHRPGNQNYGRAKIDESDGERWFCSTAEAEAAGWRAARR